MFFHHFGIESFGQDINVREISPLIAGRIVKGKMERERERKRMSMLLAYARIVKVGDGRLGEDAGEQGRDVGRVAGQKDDAEAAPDVDEELVGP